MNLGSWCSGQYILKDVGLRNSLSRGSYIVGFNKLPSSCAVYCTP